MKSEGFSVENSHLLYNGHLVGDNASTPGFRQYSFESDALGEGGNGVTYRVRHRTLRVDQVVKLYFPNKGGVSDKAKFEAIKNADPRVRDVIAQVHDAGTYSYPEAISYSVMESVSDIQTLKEWLAGRDAQWAFAEASFDCGIQNSKVKADLWKAKCRRVVMAESLSVAASVIGAIARMHAAGVTHGDLNPGNILIFQDPIDPVWARLRTQDFHSKKLDISGPNYDVFRAARNKYMRYSSEDTQPGRLTPPPVKVIDLGSSKAPGTSTQVAVARENWFVLDNLRRILKPWFGKNESMKDWFALEVAKSAEGVATYRSPTNREYPVPLVLTDQVFRLLCVLNVFLGHVDNSFDSETGVPSEAIRLGGMDRSIINVLIHGEIKGIRDEVFSLDVLRVFGVLKGEPERPYIDWKAVLGYVQRMHPGIWQTTE
ncbi:hypothetical protein [Arthrobacter sp. BF1]|uniref:hypothetical protein n=1 Tax=Arthrobacter sp. BF1 TaxID=2821145 RepID=UPI001C4F2D5D|nr:hypothetical protein [Arthrobacter sp. BF1]